MSVIWPFMWIHVWILSFLLNKSEIMSFIFRQTQILHSKLLKVKMEK